MILEANKEKTATLDHIIPRSKGGSDEVDNFVGSCNRCNIQKGDQDAFVFYSFKRSLLPLGLF